MGNKRLLALVSLLLVCVLALGVSAAPANVQPQEGVQVTPEQVAALVDSLPETGSYVYNWTTGELSPLTARSARLSYLSTVSAGISASGSTVKCSSSVSIYKDYDVDLDMELQRSTSSSGSFDGVTSWYKSVTSTGTTSFSKSYSVSSGYYYRTEAVATALSSSGRALETVVARSTSKKV